MLAFYSYRLSLLVETTLFANAQPKEQYFEDLLNELKEQQKAVFTVKNSKFILYFIGELLPDVLLLELAREEVQRAPVEGATRVEEATVYRTPFVYVIVDRIKQIVLIQDKQSVFQQPEVPVARLQYYFESRLRPNSITTALIGIADQRDFWKIVEKAEGVTEFDITLNGPNLFRGRQKAEELVEEIHDEFNADEFTIKLKNKLGQLRLLYENARDFVALAAAGGGKFVLKTLKNGVEVITRSYEFITKKRYEVDSAEQIDKDKLKSDLEELDKKNEDIG